MFLDLGGHRQFDAEFLQFVGESLHTQTIITVLAESRKHSSDDYSGRRRGPGEHSSGPGLVGPSGDSRRLEQGGAGEDGAPSRSNLKRYSGPIDPRQPQPGTIRVTAACTGSTAGAKKVIIQL